MDHPGWCKDGSVLRNQRRFYLRDSGVYHREEMKWFFEVVDIANRLSFITPITGDIYSGPPYFQERDDHSMLLRNWIVVSSQTGPSSAPMKHTSEESAIEEAKRLALKNPSAQYYVYELKRAYQVETVKEIEVSDILF